MDPDRTDAPDLPGPSRRRFLGALGTAATLGLAGCYETDDPEGTTLTDAEPTTYAREVDQDVSPYTQVYRETIDSVARIRVFTTTGVSAGSAFVYDDDYLVTNQHVVDGADDIEVQFSRGDWRDGTLVAADVYSDLAVVSVDQKPEYATPLSLVERDPPIGAEVVALGTPFGLGESVSAGIVSGVNRSFPAANSFVIADAVQFDAAANPGNSGGPLVTLDGRVVGVVTAALGNDVNFAVSSALLQRVVPALIEDGEYRHPYVGIRLIGVSPTVAEGNDLDEIRGVLVVEVVEDGPSDGVLQGSSDTELVNGRTVPVGGDVIVEMAGVPIPDTEALSTFLALQTSPGDTIPTVIVRDGERVEVSVELGVRPDPESAPSGGLGLQR